VIENIGREKAEQQRVIENLDQERVKQQGVIESLGQERVEQQRVIDKLGQEKAEHQRVIENLGHEKADQQRAIGNLDQEKAELRQLINSLNTTIQIIGWEKTDMEQLKIDRARLEERCEQSNTTIQSKEQEIKSLKGELDNTRRLHDQAGALSSIREDQSLSNDLLQWIAENHTSQPLSDTWCLVGLRWHHGHPLLMKDALFKKVTNGEEFYVEARTLVEGSLVRAADGKTIYVAEPPRQHQTDILIWLHAADAKLPLTPNHRVPIFTGGDKVEKPAKDLQT